MNESTPFAVATPGVEDFMDGHDVAELLEHLAETAENGAKGFAQAAEHVDNPSIASLFTELGSERGTFAEELRALASARYDNVDLVENSGTVAGAIHRGWIALKDALTGDDAHAVVAAAEAGEDYALEQWNEAIEKPLPNDIAAMVRRQRDAVKAAHDRVSALKDATE